MGGIFSRLSSQVLQVMVASIPFGDGVEEGSFYEPEFGERMLKVKNEVQSYKEKEGAHQEAIRSAMIAESDSERMASALETLKPAVHSIMGWFSLCEVLKSEVPKLASGAEEALKGGEDRSDLTALIGVLYLIMAIDTAKLETPGIQNEFSFVRRAATRHATLALIDPNTASTASMFIAQSSPFIAHLSMSLDPETSKRLGALASILANVVLTHQRNGIPSDEPHKVIVSLYAMTAAFILYDRSTSIPGGAFVSPSPVSAKRVATALIKKAPQPSRQQLLGAFRYTSLHFAEYASSSLQSMCDL